MFLCHRIKTAKILKQLLTHDKFIFKQLLKYNINIIIAHYGEQVNSKPLNRWNKSIKINPATNQLILILAHHKQNVNSFQSDIAMI